MVQSVNAIDSHCVYKNNTPFCRLWYVMQPWH